MTTTQTLRSSHPARYVRKDARTTLYTALYGAAQEHDAGAHPRDNSTRTRNTPPDLQAIRHTYPKCQFTPAQAWPILFDLTRVAGADFVLALTQA